MTKSLKLDSSVCGSRHKQFQAVCHALSSIISKTILYIINAVKYVTFEPLLILSGHKFYFLIPCFTLALTKLKKAPRHKVGKLKTRNNNWDDR